MKSHIYLKALLLRNSSFLSSWLNFICSRESGRWKGLPNILQNIFPIRSSVWRCRSETSATGRFRVFISTTYKAFCYDSCAHWSCQTQKSFRRFQEHSNHQCSQRISVTAFACGSEFYTSLFAYGDPWSAFNVYQNSHVQILSRNSAEQPLTASYFYTTTCARAALKTGKLIYLKVKFRSATNFQQSNQLISAGNLNQQLRWHRYWNTYSITASLLVRRAWRYWEKFCTNSNSAISTNQRETFLAAVPSAFAVHLLESGRTAHSARKIPILFSAESKRNIDTDLACSRSEWNTSHHLGQNSNDTSSQAEDRRSYNR